MLQPGDSLDGYRVIRLLGSGGFGAVWLCQSEALKDFRALKFIPATTGGQIQKEFDALSKYRTAAGQLRSPSIMPIEHANTTSDGLFYIMPLADGYGAEDPLDPAWRPLTLAATIENRRGETSWFTSEEIKGYMAPVLQALQLLSDAGLVHRDVKPENILFLQGKPCLGDISLLGEDSHNITRRGTPGYCAPSWFVESGGHPDIYGAVTTLNALLTGNPPDKMGRAAFRWPPRGEGSLSPADRQEWLRLHRVIRRAVDERPAERFRDFSQFAHALEGRAELKKSWVPKMILAACGLVIAAVAVFMGLAFIHGQTSKPSSQDNITGTPASATSRVIPKIYQPHVQAFYAALEAQRHKLTFPREKLSAAMDGISSDLQGILQQEDLRIEDAAKPLTEIKIRLKAALENVPRKPDVAARTKGLEELRSLSRRPEDVAATPSEENQYEREVRPVLDEQIEKLSQELNSENDFRTEQWMKVLPKAMDIRNRYEVNYKLEKAKDHAQWRESVGSCAQEIMDDAVHLQN